MKHVAVDEYQNYKRLCCWGKLSGDIVGCLNCLVVSLPTLYQPLQNLNLHILRCSDCGTRPSSSQILPAQNSICFCIRFLMESVKKGVFPTVPFPCFKLDLFRNREYKRVACEIPNISKADQLFYLKDSQTNGWPWDIARNGCKLIVLKQEYIRGGFLNYKYHATELSLRIVTASTKYMEIQPCGVYSKFCERPFLNGHGYALS